MEIYLFLVGFLVTCLVIASIFLINSEEKDKYKDLDKTNEVDYDWKLTIPSPSYDSIFFNNEPFIWSSNGNNSDGWVSTHRFVTNSDFNKNISSVRYQNTQVQYSGGEVLYLGT